MKITLYLVLLVNFITPGSVFPGSKELKDYLSNLPFAMPEIKEPSFPDRRFRITDYGAIADGQTLATNSFLGAIEACSKAGGGVVEVPPGTWITGPIRLESNINLYLEKGALLQFSSNIDDFPLIAGYDGKSSKFQITPPIHGFRLKNVAITGDGVIDGAGEYWRPVKKDKMTPGQWKKLVASGGAVSEDGKIWFPSKGALEGESRMNELKLSKKKGTKEEYAAAREFLRPHMVHLVQCTNILIDGPVFRNSPRFHIYPVQSENIIVRNISIQTHWYAQNGDGLDLGSCRNVVVYNITVDAGDDAICVKPGSISSRQSAGPACENIVIADCIVYRGHGGFVIGSESFGGARNISVKNCIFIGTDIGLRFKSNRGRGGLIENVFIEDIRMRDIAGEAILFDMYYGEDDSEAGAGEDKKEEAVNDLTPRFRNFQIKGVTCNKSERPLLINGLPEMPVSRIHLENLNISSAKGIVLTDADSIWLTNVDLREAAGAALTSNQSRNIFLDSVTFPDKAASFMDVAGPKSDNIQVANVDLSRAQVTFNFLNNADKKSVILK